MELLACVGLTFILKYGSVLNWPRKLLCKIGFFQELFKCSLCLGFWSGVGVYMIEQQTLLLPFASAATCWAADSAVAILQWWEIKLEKELKS